MITSSQANKGDAELSDTIGSDQKRSRVSKKSARKTHGGFAKGDVRYWQSRVRKEDSSDYSIQIAYHGQRSRFPLETPNKDAAAKKAVAIYQHLRASGWEATIAKYKPGTVKPVKGSTVGELLTAVAELANVRPVTLRSYQATFRRIVADVEGIEANAGRFARTGDGRASWLAAVDAVPLANLTPDKIEAWKLRYVRSRAKKDETQARASKNSANSLIRMGKGLFAKRLLRLVTNRVILPSPLPFDGVDLFPRQSMRYVSTMDVDKLLTSARDELAVNDPEAFKAFLLGMFGGLRRNEADKIRWTSVDFDTGVIRVESQSDFAPKAETSLDDVPLDAEVTAILRGLRAREPDAIYVLAADVPKRKFKTPPPLKKDSTDKLNWAKYRANATFTRLTTWLRANGVKARTPLHTLRKEAGSLIAEKEGIFAASRFLRHADVAITAQHYAAQKKRVTVGLGSMMLPAGKNILPFQNDSAQAEPARKRTQPARREVSAR
ncbi:tyrosine-type recombinase/integrase [Prosthecobacter sp. SYSU 5D2]|uniref:tyrosine-type recombinase/integrase n=1 Tax=Prosthecobacter sp. SYSU 5D2 TaxID=3134134 RepID=UPI0031FF2E53